MAEEARNRLGRGLAALIGDIGNEATVVERSRGQRKIPVAFLRPNPRNPRKSYNSEDLDELAASVREKGIVQPILVRPVHGADDLFEIIAGERRWRAAQRAGLHDVPVVVHDVDDRQALEIAIVENVQRADLNPLEEAHGYQQLLADYGYSQGKLAEIIGKSRPHIANTLRLLRLPSRVQDYLREGKLTAGHARALVTLADPEAAAERIVAAGLSVRAAESIAGDDKEARHSKRAREQDADTRALEKAVSDGLGLAVSIRHKARGGDLRVSYKTLEQLEEVCRRLRRA